MRLSLGRSFDRVAPRGWRRAALAAAVSAFALLWLGGVATHWHGPARAEEAWLASLFLSLAGVIVLFGARTRRDVAALAAIALFGFAVEIAGANTGLPFGSYHYTDALRPRLLGAPLVIGAAWMVLVAQAWSIFAPLGLPRALAVALAALWTTAVDLVIDPLAANHLGYWRWQHAGLYYGIPASNFAGWLLTSLAALALFGRRLEPNFWARAAGFAITLFFTLGALANRLTLAAFVGLALCAAQLLLSLRARNPRAAGAEGDGDGATD